MNMDSYSISSQALDSVNRGMSCCWQLIPTECQNDWYSWSFYRWVKNLEAIVILMKNGDFSYQVLTLLRAQLENYADLVNFAEYGPIYGEYLAYLSDENTLTQDNVEKVRAALNVKNLWRTTRYYLRNRQVKELRRHVFQWADCYPIMEFDSVVWSLDKQLSRFVHSNPGYPYQYINILFVAEYLMACQIVHSFYRYHGLIFDDVYYRIRTILDSYHMIIGSTGMTAAVSAALPELT